MKKWIIGLLMVALAGGGIYYWFIRANGQAAADSEIQTVKATRGPIRDTVECTGLVVSNLDVEIKCLASGEVISVPYDISDPVTKGALLVELDPQDEERNVLKAQIELLSADARLHQASETLITSERELEVSERKARADLESAEAQRDDSRAKADRMEALLKSGRVSPEETETAQTTAKLDIVKVENARIALEQIAVDRKALAIKREDVRKAEADLRSAEISLEIAQKRLKDTKVFAPIDGTLVDRQVEIGQIISSAVSNVGGGSTLLVLSDLSRLFVLASVDESDIGKIQVEQPVEVTVDAYPGVKFVGRVDRIATKGTNVSNVVTFEVKIEVLGENKSRLKPEMTANVEILVAEENDAVIVPAEAVQRKKDEYIVFLAGLPGGASVEQVVKKGIDDGIQVQILSGVSEGAEILLPSNGTSGQWTKNSQPNPMMPPPPGRR